MTQSQLAWVVDLIIQDKTESEAIVYLEKIQKAIDLTLPKIQDEEKKQLLNDLVIEVEKKIWELKKETIADEIFAQIQREIEIANQANQGTDQEYQSQESLQRELIEYTSKIASIEQKTEYGLLRFFELMMQAWQDLQSWYYDHTYYDKEFDTAYNDAYRWLKLVIDELKQQLGFKWDEKYRDDLVWFYNEFFILLTTDYKYMADTLSMDPNTWSDARINKINSIWSAVSTRFEELWEQNYRITKQFYERHGFEYVGPM